MLGFPQMAVLEAAGTVAAAPAPRPFRVPLMRADAVEVLSPSATTMGGWLGERIHINATNRLLNVDTEPLLAGFRGKPGSHPWIGEHVGKWLHAATLAWANNHDPALRAKLDRVAAGLTAAQEADGYLGTYVPEKRFGLFDGADWDVWSHKYCLIGLLTYHQFTGDAPALLASRKAADLLLATFPARRSILAAGTHQGMAATSVLEPIVLLYRLTGDARYLGFARYIVQSWDEENGPAIVKTLLRDKQVRKVSNAKAYEMLSNLVGLCELARVTGDDRLIEASLIAWQDIVDRRLYLTGTTSRWEHFQDDHDQLGDVRAHVGETCVTTTWIQFNLSLLQMTGEARFAAQLERTFYNHLTAAQHPRGDDWCYFTALEGRKHYDKGITCCHSSGPRGLALAVQAAYLRGRENDTDVLLVNTLESSTVSVALGGEVVRVVQDSGFPMHGQSQIRLELERPATFAVKVRRPDWAIPMSITGGATRDGWIVLPARAWQSGDVITVKFHLASRVEPGRHTQAGRAALAWGPFVLACEQDINPGLSAPHRLGLTRKAVRVHSSPGQPLQFEAEVFDQPEARLRPAKFLAFADAGTGQGLFRIWMRAPGLTAPGPGESLLAEGTESRSRGGNPGGLANGSINDEDFESFVSTFNGHPADEDWFAVTLARPATVRRIVFTHGRNFRDGGWFDTEAGKPRVQIRRSVGGAWETIGELLAYPATTATNGKSVEKWDMDARFTLTLDAPVRLMAVRVIGKPACGDDPKQAFASCTELQAFA